MSTHITIVDDLDTTGSMVLSLAGYGLVVAYRDGDGVGIRTLDSGMPPVDTREAIRSFFRERQGQGNQASACAR